MNPMTLRLRHGIAAYEVLAGAIGIAGFGVFWRAMAADAVEEPVVIGVLVALALANMVAGVRLGRRAPAGRALSLLVQGAQLPTIVVPGFAYSLSLTLRLEFG